MFQTIKKTAAIAITLTLSTQAFAFGSTVLNDFSDEGTFEIRVENLMKSQILTPPLIVIGEETVFKVGEPASRALSFLAEDGDLTDFKDSGSFENALFPTSGIEPGKVNTYELTAKFSDVIFLNHFKISFASMLASTNDAFVGLERGVLQGGFGSPFSVGMSRSFNLNVYDAGTESNTESCSHIPGPPCGSHNVRAERGAEGVVSRHPGLRLFRSSLDHSHLFPTVGARITVTRTK